ncbi:hypothetical protein DICPUDRAFT_96471 [Dictyostelium purpureum]|uniref:Uncharacterized protein n=1 Tax=Dictyostelium purpureum TaxID=5786 RepID=F0Z8J6_DICPU|nr:uncharacterized protein DICPUDRAFT_96471 [Dictyostelium purpureum]EGC39772.1 hypothetical protein DICPUDRAFT_96471 [Dictyostelium purpureum]|eukprot:XP_003283758.1 hypothetical protein DICPUDRAFT_96471 [Dictyostelium purpureum]
MSVYCELNDVIHQIRYKTQIFYETFKRDSIAEQIYNFSNESSSDIDPDVQYSKSLDKDYSILYKPIISQSSTPSAVTPGVNTPTSALSPPQQQPSQQPQAQQNNKPTTATTASTVTSPATTSASSCTSGTTQTTSSSSSSTTVTSTNSSTMSSLTSTDASASSSAFSQQPVQQNNQQSSNSQQQAPQQAPQQQQPQQNNSQPSTSPKKCKIVTFTGTSVKLNKPINPKDNKTNIVPDKTTTATNISSPAATNTPQQPDKTNEPVFVFVKEKVVKAPVQTTESLLTRLVRPNHDESHDYGDIIPPPLGPGMSLKIFIANLNQAVSIKVVEKATILQTIVATLRAFHSSGGVGLPSSDPKAYHIRIADSNGKVDQDFPPLDLNGYISKFKDETLLLCLNPKFDLKKSGSSLSISGGIQPPPGSSTSSSTSSNGSNVNNNLKASTGGMNNSQQQQSQQQLQHHNSQAQLQQNSQAQLQQQNSQAQLQPQQTSEGGGGGHHHHNYRTHHRSVSSGPDAPLVVKITLPDSSITKVVFQKTMLLKDLLESTCKKRKLLVSDHYFTLENGRICEGILPMEKLGGADLILVSKRPIEVTTLSPSDTDSNGSDLQQEIFWYDALAWQYKTYEVTKLKKYSSKQERIIGIDKERITNMSPKDAETKRPARLIKDISKIALLEKPKYFTIEYNDGKSYIYEARTTSIANEIVGKISYILGKN